MIAAFLLFCALVAVCIKVSKTYRRTMGMAAKVPAWPGCLPLIGHGLRVLGLDGEDTFKLMEELTDYTSKSGGVCVAYLKMRPHFIITDPDDAFIVMNEALDKGYMYKFLSPWLGDGLFTSDAAIWYSHRKMLRPAFNSAVISSFQSVFEKRAIKLADDLAPEVGKGPFDVTRYVEVCFLETIYETALGMPEGEAMDADFAHYTQKMFAITIKRILTTYYHLEFIFNLSNLKRDQDDVVKVLHKISNEVIESRKTEFKNKSDYSGFEEKRFKPFLHHILELSTEKGALTPTAVREEVDTIIMAGQDTSALVLQFLLITLGSHLDVQEKVYTEIQDIFSNEDREITKEDLSQLKYTEAVINETLRLYPLGVMIPRDVNKDIQLRNFTIPSGSTAMISIWGIHRGKHWGPDAEVFRPERWLDAASLPDLRTAFGGFSFGKRTCIGKSYAICLMKTIMVKLLRRYRVRSNASELKLQVDIMLRPASGNHITLEAR